MCWTGDDTAIRKIAERDFYVYKIGKIVWNNIFISDIRGYNYAPKCLNRIVPLVPYGLGEGLQGNAYALPTKDLRVKENGGLRSISKEDIIKSIKKLYETAKQYSDKQFKIAYRNTYSTSLNGYTGLEMIDMFLEAGPIPDNIIFSKEWIDTGKL